MSGKARAGGGSSASADQVATVHDPRRSLDITTNDTRSDTMSRLQQGISKLNSLSNHGGSSISRLSSPSMGGTTGSGGKNLRRTQAADPLEAGRAARLHRASSDLSSDAMRRDIRRVIEHLCDTENPLLNRIEREKLIEEILDETLGFGPLEILLKDPTISDILVNGPHKVLRRASRQAGKDRGEVPGQRPPAADHRPHRVEGRPARR